MVRKKYSEYVERIPTDFEQNYIIVVLKMDKELLQTSKAIMLVRSNILPYDSSYWKNTQYGLGLEQLEQCILDLHLLAVTW